MTDNQMALGVLIYQFGGSAPSGWRDPSVASYGPNGISYYADIAVEAESAFMDLIFLPDTPVVSMGDPAALAQMEAKSTRPDPGRRLPGGALPRRHRRRVRPALARPARRPHGRQPTRRPEPQRRGLYRTAHEGTTLRCHLGVAVPA